MTTIAVVGAGLSGLVAARGLTRDHDVTVFEKSRSVGGRIATRYAAGCEFDHGAQFFTAQSAAFQTFLQPLIEQGVVAAWPARIAELERSKVIATRQWNDENPHYVGVPRMNAIGKWLATELDVRLLTTVARLEQRNDRWLLVDPEGSTLGQFDWVVVTAPAPQTAALLPASVHMRRHIEAVHMDGCFSLMMAFEQPLELSWQAARVHEADISWLSVNSSKPGRAGEFCLVVHSTNAWADAHIDDDESVITHLLAECSDVMGVDVDKAVFCSMHRWRYANIDAADGPGCYIDADMQLAACGEWCIQGRVEAAYQSALALLEALKRHV